jgi:hypothetical protein
VLLLERLDESNVLLLGVGRRDTLVDQLLPCVSLGLALLLIKRVSGVFRLEEQMSRVECRCYLEVEHAGLVRGLDGRVLGTLLEQSVKLYHSSQSMWLPPSCLVFSRTWRSSSSEGLALSLRLSSMAFLKSAVWATIFAVIYGLGRVCSVGGRFGDGRKERWWQKMRGFQNPSRGLI